MLIVWSNYNLGRYHYLVVARFTMGICFSALWTTTEIWLNEVVDDEHRGRIVGGSGTLYAICQFVGPLVLSVAGVTGYLPLLIPMLPLAAGARGNHSRSRGPPIWRPGTGPFAPPRLQRSFRVSDAIDCHLVYVGGRRDGYAEPIAALRGSAWPQRRWCRPPRCDLQRRRSCPSPGAWLDGRSARPSHGAPHGRNHCCNEHDCAATCDGQPRANARELVLGRRYDIGHLRLLVSFS